MGRAKVVTVMRWCAGLCKVALQLSIVTL